MLAWCPPAWKTNRRTTGGTLGGTRTPNLLVRSQALYPLSYEGKAWCACGSIAAAWAACHCACTLAPSCSGAPPVRKIRHIMNDGSGAVQMDVRNRQAIGTAALLLGALLVGVAIVMDSDAGRVVNGLGGVLWFSGTGLLTLEAVRSRPSAWLWL